MARRLGVTVALALLPAIGLLANADALGADASARAAGVSFASAACPQGPAGVSQSMRGAISACVRVGAFGPGPYTLVIDQVLNEASADSPKPAPAPKLHKPKAPHEPAVALTLSPASGAPGSAVTFTGRVSRRVTGSSGYVNICWDGCADGLQYGAVAIHWTSARSFHGRFVVPGAPWIEGDPARVAPLASGSYQVAVQCLEVGSGCAAQPSEGAASFALHAAAAPGWCPSAAACARLKLSPGAARPGDVVRVSGFAPLQSVTGANQPFVFGLEVLRGSPHGPEVAFSSRRGVLGVTLGHGGLTVEAPPRFTGYPGTPVSSLSAGLPAIAADPADPSTVAWCADDGVHVSQSGSVSTVSIAGAAPVLKRLGFEASAGQPPICVGVAPLGGSGSTPAVAVAFSAGLARYGAPPVYDVALQTSDGGQSWTPVPVPPGATAESFGGFRYQSGSVAAVFASSRVERTKGGGSYPTIDVDRPLVETTGDAGASWQPGRLACPAAGPCVTLGPYIPENCAMVQDEQPLLRSTDGGATWSQPALPDSVQACGDAQLLALGDRSLVLLNPASQYLLVGSSDGGLTWGDRGVPAVPGVPSFGFPSQTGVGDGLGPGPGGITALAGGTLLDTGVTRAWHLLAPGARSWCEVSSVPAALMREPQLTPLTVIGDQLWWLTGFYQAKPTMHTLAAASITC